MKYHLIATLILWMAWLPCRAQTAIPSFMDADIIYLSGQDGREYPVPVKLLDSAKWAGIASNALLPDTAGRLQKGATMFYGFKVKEERTYYCVLPVRDQPGPYTPHFIQQFSTQFSIKGLLSGKAGRLRYSGKGNWAPVAAWLSAPDELWLQIKTIDGWPAQPHYISLRLPFGSHKK